MINKIYYLEAASQNPVGCQYIVTNFDFFEVAPDKRRRFKMSYQIVMKPSSMPHGVLVTVADKDTWFLEFHTHLLGCYTKLLCNFSH